MRIEPKYQRADMVSYKLSLRSNKTYYGVIVSHYQTNYNKIVYEIAALNDGMCSYSIGEHYIVKKID